MPKTVLGQCRTAGNNKMCNLPIRTIINSIESHYHSSCVSFNKDLWQVQSSGDVKGLVSRFSLCTERIRRLEAVHPSPFDITRAVTKNHSCNCSSVPISGIKVKFQVSRCWRHPVADHSLEIRNTSLPFSVLTSFPIFGIFFIDHRRKISPRRGLATWELFSAMAASFFFNSLMVDLHLQKVPNKASMSSRLLPCVSGNIV